MNTMVYCANRPTTGLTIFIKSFQRIAIASRCEQEGLLITDRYVNVLVAVSDVRRESWRDREQAQFAARFLGHRQGKCPAQLELSNHRPLALIAFRFIGRFMLVFGVISTLFDLVTFRLLLTRFHADIAVFRTGWFVESLLTELVVALVMRTRPFFRSRPERLLLVSSIVLIPVGFAIPYLPFAGVFGFVALPGTLAMTIALIVVLYVAATELAKRWFYNARAEDRQRVSGSARRNR
jgi:hypothetical protein